MTSKNILIIKVLKLHIKNISKLNKSFDFTRKQQKLSITLDEYLNEILYVLKTGISWRDIRSKINWSTE